VDDGHVVGVREDVLKSRLVIGRFNFDNEKSLTRCPRNASCSEKTWGMSNS
jgi:hypothetical protein